ncbi:hypothetical protein L6164_019307 [Bauhinia variegata]|uniref:Uncharacterized protein n=1 Tax=Bauhinia variegata TaxID=167791 RepID=A0ACB9MR55_BAUVA|nr:hypothetical protein L6164_019307 [Bauhinia variegata]
MEDDNGNYEVFMVGETKRTGQKECTSIIALEVAYKENKELIGNGARPSTKEEWTVKKKKREKIKYKKDNRIAKMPPVCHSFSEKSCKILNHFLLSVHYRKCLSYIEQTRFQPYFLF